VDAASRQQSRNLRRVVETLTEATYPLSQAVLEHMSGLSGAQLLLLDDRGEVIYTTISVGTDDLAALESPDRQQTDDLFSAANVVRLKGDAYFSDLVPMAGPGRGSGPDRLVVLYPKARWWSIARQVASPILLAGSVTTLAAMLVSVIIAARFVHPIRMLRNQTEAIAGGRFRPIEVPARNDEIGDLAISINSMTEKLSRYESEVRRSERLRTLDQLGVGLAHQLRNCAAGARMAVELYQREVAGAPDAEALQTALRQMELMESHLERILTLGRCEPVSLEEVALQSVIEEVLPLVRPTCEHAKIRLSTQCPDEPIYVRGDGRSLCQLLTDLILNAAHAAGAQVKADSQIMIELERSAGGRVLLRVKDSGRGPSVAIEDGIYDPFVTDKPEGTGLGLYLARQIVQAHAGEISWSREDNMTCFAVELPAAKSE
jgi:signal transduction histidine kinase